MQERLYDVAQEGGGRYGKRDHRPIDADTKRGRRRHPFRTKFPCTYTLHLRRGFEILGVEPERLSKAEPIQPPSEQDLRRWGQREFVPFEPLDGETPCREERCQRYDLHPIHIKPE